MGEYLRKVIVNVHCEAFWQRWKTLWHQKESKRCAFVRTRLRLISFTISYYSIAIPIYSILLLYQTILTTTFN